MAKFNRRQFFALSTAIAGTAIAANWAVGETSPALQSFSRPRLHSKDGLLELDLEVSYRPVKLGKRTAYLLCYNGQVPAPCLEAKAGDTVRIHFTNNLAEPTNIHYHGLHISPTGNADNVFLNIDPGAKLTYEFTIGQNHPAGTFWYHPHKHGYVAEQLFAGLAGMFIVRGELDEIPEVKAAKEEIVILKDFALDDRGYLLPPNPHQVMMTGREGDLLTVNGQVNFSLSIASGGLLRLRLLNASPSRFYRLKLENHSFHLIATDGGAIASPVELEELLLTPGERADVLIRGNSQPGQYRLLNLPYDRGGMGMMGGGNMMMGGGGMMNGQAVDRPQVLATLTYQGSIAALPLPQQLIPVETLPESEIAQRLELSMQMGMGKMAFTFNNQVYQPERVDTQVKLNTIEDWEIINVETDGMQHPFHLHVNPFQVVSRNGEPEPYQAWKDTILIRSGETVRIRIPFRDFTGKTVYHCHILDHEDLGMMGNLEIIS